MVLMQSKEGSVSRSIDAKGEADSIAYHAPSKKKKDSRLTNSMSMKQRTNNTGGKLAISISGGPAAPNRRRQHNLIGG